MAAAAAMIGPANTKLANSRQECLDALIAHGAIHEAAEALGLFDGISAAAAAQGHQVLGALNAVQNAAAHSAIHDALVANQTVLLAWQEDANIDVVVSAGPAGEVVVTFHAPNGH